MPGTFDEVLAFTAAGHATTSRAAISLSMTRSPGASASGLEGASRVLGLSTGTGVIALLVAKLAGPISLWSAVRAP